DNRVGACSYTAARACHAPPRWSSRISCGGRTRASRTRFTSSRTRVASSIRTWVSLVSYCSVRSACTLRPRVLVLCSECIGWLLTLPTTLFTLFLRWSTTHAPTRLIRVGRLLCMFLVLYMCGLGRSVAR
ncbi:hypothetical protein VIGAN_01092400, partial [Vigna angularis var. angularis]